MVIGFLPDIIFSPGMSNFPSKRFLLVLIIGPWAFLLILPLRRLTLCLSTISDTNVQFLSYTWMGPRAGRRILAGCHVPPLCSFVTFAYFCLPSPWLGIFCVPQRTFVLALLSSAFISSGPFLNVFAVSLLLALHVVAWPWLEIMNVGHGI